MNSLSFEAGAAIACGTGTAWGALRRMKLSGRDTIAVFGQGPVGLSATYLATAMGARVIALDIEHARLAAAAEFGAWKVVNPREENAVAAIHQLTAGRGAEMALETSGSDTGASDALECVKVWGMVCLVGIGATVNFEVRAFLRKQISVLTSLTMSIVDQKHCADFIVERGLEADRIFTDRWRLEDAGEAYRRFDRQNAGKGVFVF